MDRGVIFRLWFELNPNDPAGSFFADRPCNAIRESLLLLPPASQLAVIVGLLAFVVTLWHAATMQNGDDGLASQHNQARWCTRELRPFLPSSKSPVANWYQCCSGSHIGTLSQENGARYYVLYSAQQGRNYWLTSGTPEICQLPAGMADKNKLVLYPLY